MTDNETLADEGSSNVRRTLTMLLSGVAIIFLFGVLFGFGRAVFDDDGLSTSSVLVLAGLVIAIMMIGAFIWKQMKQHSAQAMASSERKSRTIYIVSMVIGGLVGMYIVATGGSELSSIFSNDPVSSLTAVGAIAGFGLAMPVITILWWNVTDEHELKAYSDGAIIAFHLYIFLVPSWWMAARAGWVPRQDPMIVLMVVVLVWSAVWLVRKYR